MPSSPNPVSPILAAYGREALASRSLDEILDRTVPLQGDPFVVSGLYDLRTALEIVDDLYRGHVRLAWRPIDLAQSHSLWREHAGAKTFLPEVILPTYVQQDKRSWKRLAAGEEASQNAVMVLAITDLWRAAYLPKVGDQVVYRNTRYEVLAAAVNPEHYWQATGFPLYWTCEMGIATQDSRFTGCNTGGSLEQGAPSTEEPLILLDTGEPL